MLKVNELLQATRGKLINGEKDFAIKAFSIDSRTIKKGETFIAIKGDNFDGHAFIDAAIKKGASCIIKITNHKSQITKKVTCIGVKDTTKALADIARFMRQKFNIPVIAISGSNGKTTVKEMIAWVLSGKFKVLKNEGTKNNHIGLPLTLLGLDSGFDIGVLELGTNHFHEIENLVKICLPNIGIITNIAPAHLEYFGDLRGVFREKYTLIKNLEEPYIGILNNDDPLFKKEILKKTKQPPIFSFGIKNKSDFSATIIRSLAGKTEFMAGKQKFVLNTRGEYNVYNALAAIAAARIFGLTCKDIAKRLASFDFPQGRMKMISLNQATLIDDTYNSNPLSLKAALNTLKSIKTKGRKIVVMGDMLELGQDREIMHFEAGREVAKVCDIFIAVGPLSKFAAEAAKICGKKKVFSCKSSQEAGRLLFHKITPKENDLVLVKGSRAMKMEGVFK